MAQRKEMRGPFRQDEAEFYRKQIERVLRGQLTVAVLSRDIGVARSQIRRWKYLLPKGGETAISSDAEVMPAAELRLAQLRIRTAP